MLFGGVNFHLKQKQWKGIVDTIGTNHDKPMTPCYKKLTLILYSQPKETVASLTQSVRTITISVIKLE